MKVKVLNGVLHHGDKVIGEGQIVELKDPEAKGLIEAGIVEAFGKVTKEKPEGDTGGKDKAEGGGGKEE